jgi:hypothetical protein
MSKELWVVEFDRLYDEALDAGKSNADAAQWAQDNAQDAVVDRITATIDNARMRERAL